MRTQTGAGIRARVHPPGIVGWITALLGVLCIGVGPVSAQENTFENAYARAAELVARMTLQQKIDQLHGIGTPSAYRIVPGIPELRIPPLRITNGPAGVGPGGRGPQLRATALPAPIALAASWDPLLAKQYGRTAGVETLALGSDLLEAPDINIVRVPQSGRSFEGFGEDPWLTSRLAVAEIEGIQEAGAIANVKHYLANNQETERGTINEVISERALHEIYMSGFRASVEEANVDSVMCAYPRVNGKYNCENDVLLDHTLKGDWKFRGFVTSDFGAVHSTVPSIMAGLDLELPTGIYFSSALKTAVQDKQVPISRIDDALIRRYTVMIRRGLFDRKTLESASRTPSEIFASGKTLRAIAEEGMVLLKNDHNLLPLNAQELHKVALVGPGAVRAITGGGGSSYVNPFYTIRPEDGIYSQMLSQRKLVVLDGSDQDAAVQAARNSDVAIVMLADEETESDDHSLSLPSRQDELVRAIAAANQRTIVVLKTGSAVLMPWVDSVPAILEAWYPGEEDGNAVADVLFGISDPGGRLPITFPRRTEDTLARNIEQYPGKNGRADYSEGIDVGYRGYMQESIKPLFPFGFGLSYTTFTFQNLAVAQVAPGPNPKVEVSFEVKNTGARTGWAVPQIYVGFPHLPEGDEPPLQLKGFQKLELKPGESRRIAIMLDAGAFSWWSERVHHWVLERGPFRIALASSSADIKESHEIALK